MANAKLTKNSTKDLIWTALQEATEKLNDLKNSKVDFKAEIEQKKTQDTVSKAIEVSKKPVEEIIAEINSKVSESLTNVAEAITAGVNEFNEVNNAIAIQKRELQDLYGVNDELLNLAAIVNTKKDLQADIETMKKDRDAEEKAYKADRDASRKKEEAENKYEFDRKKKLDTDLWNDEKTNKKKDFTAEMDDERKRLEDKETFIIKREEDIKAREVKIMDLEAQVAAIPSRIEDAVNKAVADKEKSMNTSYAIKESYMKKDSDNQVKLAESKNENLVERLDGANKIIDDLTAKLNQAYLEIKDMANKSMETAGNAKTAADLREMMNKMTGGNK